MTRNTREAILFALITLAVCMFLPEHAAAEEPGLYEQWVQEAMANDDEVNIERFLAHVARIGDPKPLVEYLWPLQPSFALQVFSCESGRYAPEVIYGRTRGLSGEVGVAQIHPTHQNGNLQAAGFSWEDMADPAYNLRFARWLYERSGWAPWTCAALAVRSRV